MKESKQLNLALLLLSAGLIFYIIAGVTPAIITPSAFTRFCLWFVPIKALIYAFLIWQIRAEQSWARITTLIIYLLCLVSFLSFAAVFQSFLYNPPSKEVDFFITHQHAFTVSLIFGSIEKVFETIAIFLLFTKKMNKVFAHKTRS